MEINEILFLLEESEKKIKITIWENWDQEERRWRKRFEKENEGEKG